MLDDQLLFPSTQIAEPNFQSIMRALSIHGSGLFGRPIPILTFIFNHAAFGSDPFGYKLVNLGFHLLNTVLVFVLGFLIFSSITNSARNTFGSPSTLALLAATIWAIHPLQVSTVLYVFQRMMLLSTLFTLCSLICYTYARSSNKSNTQRALILFVIFPIFQLCALASKENGALIPIYIILLEAAIFRFRYRDNTEAAIGKAFILLCVLLPIALAVYYFFTHIPQIMEGYNGRDFTLIDRLRTETVALAFYLKLILLPNISQMSLYHDGFSIFRDLSPTFIGSALLLFLLVIVALIGINKLRVVSIGIGIFFVAHLLESTFIPLELVFEHRNYFAVFGVCLIGAWLISNLQNAYPSKPIGSIVTCVMILFLSTMTLSRSLEWSEIFTFNTIAVENKPESARAIKALVTTHTNVRQFDEAQKVLSVAKSRFPDKVSLDISQLVLNCLAGSHSEEDIEKTRQRLGSEALRQEVPPTFSTLLKINYDGLCDNISIESINNLLTVAVNNPDKRMPQIFKSILWHSHYQTNSILAEHETAYASLAQATEESPDHPELLAVLAGLQIERDEIHDAKKNIGKLSRISKKYGGAYRETIESLESALPAQQFSDIAEAE